MSVFVHAGGGVKNGKILSTAGKGFVNEKIESLY